MGWRCEGRPPDLDKYVMIGAPHTSNWDFPIGLALLFSLDLRLYWLGKHTLFRRPFGALFSLLGGVPVDRTRSGGVVNQIIRAFEENDRMILVLSPEGTRKRITHWKTGFYYIAHGAGVPIVPAYVDYRRGVGGFGPLLHPTGNIEADMKTIGASYVNAFGKHGEKVGTITINRKAS
jgi:1-acyl-sn-glycerol-3-phosphate acyltransferase